jgi:hypothetical protein
MATTSYNAQKAGTGSSHISLSTKESGAKCRIFYGLSNETYLEKIGWGILFYVFTLLICQIQGKKRIFFLSSTSSKQKLLPTVKKHKKFALI